jgi:transglutaminase-like putative cysteine protease
MDLRRTLAPTCALAALSAAVAAGFARVISGDAWVAPVLGAAIAPHAIALVTRRRSISAIMSLTFAGLAAYVIWVLLGHTTAMGVPTGRTLDALSHRLDAGLLSLRNDTAPVAPRPGVILLAVLAVWVMAAWADYLAFRRNASIGALAPGITLFIWIAALAPTSDSPVGAAVGMVITGAGFLALQHQLLLTRRRAAFGSDGDANETLPAPRLVVGALALASVAAVIAVALAPALPGAGADPLVDLRNDDRGSSTYQTSVPPLIDVADSLRRGEQVPVFTVAADEAQYWRTVALDDYSDESGGQWTLRAAGGDIAHGLDEEPTGPTVTQTYRIGDLGERWMPAAFEPVSVSLDDTLVVETSRTLVTNEDAVQGLRYRVVSQPPPVELTEAQRRATAQPLPSALEKYTEVPESLRDSLARIALEEIQGAATPYDRARLLRDYFRGPEFTYDTTVNYTDAVSGTTAFLASKRGFCVQFASTYALMARTLGIPARVAVGYTPGEIDATTGRYSVTNYEAHAWPEIWLAGVGWTNQFDPTPPSAFPGGSNLPNDTFRGTVAPTPPPATTPTTLQTSPSDTAVANTVPAPAPVPVPAPVGATESGRDWTTPVLWALLVGVLVAIVVAVVPLAKRARRRARQRRADPTGRVAGAWEEAVDRLRELGRPAPRTTTPAEHARAATTTVGESAARPLAAVADAHTAAQFGTAAPTDADADAAWRDLDAFTGELGRHLPLTTRLRARLRVRSLRRPRDPRDPRDGQLEAVGASAVRSSSTND